MKETVVLTIHKGLMNIQTDLPGSHVTLTRTPSGGQVDLHGIIRSVFTLDLKIEYTIQIVKTGGLINVSAECFSIGWRGAMAENP